MMRDKNYENDLINTVKEMSDLLDSYSDQAISLKRTEQLAIERALQVLIEAMIGFSRYFVKLKFDIVVEKSRAAIDILSSRDVLTVACYDELKKIIGLRNILVHDYLKVDKAIIVNVIQQRSYHEIKKVVLMLESAL